MGFDDLDDAAHITFRFEQVATGEIHQFGFSTGLRGEFSQATMFDALEAWLDDDGSSLVAQSTLKSIIYSEWDTEGFTGWHQRSERMTDITSGTGAILPPQDAVVVSLLNLDDVADSIKRRRGRMYFGLVPTSHVGSDGKLTTGTITLYNSILPGLQTALLLEPGSSDNVNGLGIASQAAHKLYAANKFGVGRGVDTQRRRREKVAESIVYTTLALA